MDTKYILLGPVDLAVLRGDIKENKTGPLKAWIKSNVGLTREELAKGHKELVPIMVGNENELLFEIVQNKIDKGNNLYVHWDEEKGILTWYDGKDIVKAGSRKHT